MTQATPLYYPSWIDNVPFPVFQDAEKRTRTVKVADKGKYIHVLELLSCIFQDADTQKALFDLVKDHYEDKVNSPIRWMPPYKTDYFLPIDTFYTNLETLIALKDKEDEERYAKRLEIYERQLAKNINLRKHRSKPAELVYTIPRETLAKLREYQNLFIEQSDTKQ